MRILHIHPAMRSGGIESMICGLANEMAKTEDVTVCSIFKPRHEDMAWHKLSADVKKVDLGKSKPGFSVKEVFKIYKLFRNGGYDVVNMHGMFYYYAFSILLLHRRIKFFYTVHSDASKENSSWDAKLVPLKRYCFRKGYVHPITISDASQASFKELYHCKSTLIYNGVAKPVLTAVDPTRKYRFTPKTKVFIHAGRIDPAKNQLVLCKVFKRLIKEGQDVVLLIAGANQQQTVFDAIKPFFSDRIVYIGERSDIPQIMSYCDGMCLPSIWEGMPIVLLESLSVGCIPICSPVGGIVNVVKNGYNGFLSKSSSETDFYNTMKSLLSLSNDIIAEIKGNGIRSFAKYDITQTALSYLNLYHTTNR